MAGQDREPLPLHPLTAFSPVDGRNWKDVRDLSYNASEFGLIRARFEVEGRHLIGLSKFGVLRPLSGQEVDFLTNLGPNLTLEQAQIVKDIEDVTDHDVKAAEIAARRFMAGTSLEDLAVYWHAILTSRDTDNIAYRLLARRATDENCLPAIEELADQIKEKAVKYRGKPMKARTHGQDAVGTEVGKEFVNVGVRIEKEAAALRTHEFTGKITGAVGNMNAFDAFDDTVDWISYSKWLVGEFGFKPNLITTQINPYEDFISFFQTYQRLNGAVLDFDQDVWRYISDHLFVLKADANTVGSSTMPQKINPIRFENSAGNIKVANGFFSTFTRELPVSRLQGDLEDSTVLRNVGVALAHSLLAYRNTTRGLRRVDVNVDKAREDLASEYSILAEPAQTMLKKLHPDLEDPYSLLKAFTRGKGITRADWEKWIDNDLPASVGAEARDRLRAMDPVKYVGRASQLTDIGLELMDEYRQQGRLHAA